MENNLTLVDRARAFSIEAHTRIDHRRKYSHQPYSDHLASVARIVGSVTDNEEMIAAAWLHDVVEDTPATLYDIETAFGKEVAVLVENLTDVSKPGDGNRATRKEIDRQHIALGSSRAKTVKLADLIDNSQDICKHDMRFAKTFLVEMGALLEVLDAGDRQLYQRAWKSYHRCQNKIDVSADQSTEFLEETKEHHPLGTNNPHLFRLFTEAFSAQDVSEPVRSFDASRPCAEILALMELHDLEIVCLRKQGVISGYVKRVDLQGKLCGDHMRLFRSGQTISADRSLIDVIHILTVQRYGFITMLGEVSGYFSRNDINKPVVRMWLFGIITFIEIEILKIIRKNFPNDTWQSAITDKRLEQASSLQQERERRGQQSQLLDCLQLSDKVKILISKQETLDEIGLGSRASAKKVIKEIESLRNNLSHSQDIVTYDWAQIVRITHRLQESI
jgi:hypothetical protein